MIQRLLFRILTDIGYLTLVYLAGRRTLGDQIFHSAVTVTACVGLVFLGFRLATTGYDCYLDWRSGWTRFKSDEGDTPNP
jgi:hypothetical protein